MLTASFAAAQANDAAAIERAKSAVVYSFDKALPKTSLESFLTQAAPGAKVKWESNDCGEQSGDPEIDSQRDIPICAQASITASNGRTAVVMVAVGSLKKGVSGRPELFDVSVTSEDGLSETIQLRDLQKQIQASDTQTGAASEK
jgi:hypothetical protein